MNERESSESPSNIHSMEAMNGRLAQMYVGDAS